MSATPDSTRPTRDRERGARPSKYADLVAQRVISEIVDGNLQPGAMLPSEKEMLERYGVGRGTLREALRHLELQGVLTIRPGPGGGPQVAVPSAGNLASTVTLLLTVSRAPFREVVDVAVVLAPGMAQLAAAHAARSDVVALREQLARMEQLVRAKDPEAYLREHHHFQALLATSTGNGLFAMLWGALQNIISGGHTVSYSLAQARITQTTLTALVDAVDNGDGARARAVMRDHIEAWQKMLNRQHADALDRPVRWGEP